MVVTRKMHSTAMVLGGIVVLLFGGLRAGAAVRLASIFTSQMVLQRGMADPVWGLAKPGQTVKVSFGGNTVSTQTNYTGHWMVKLPPMKANAHPQTLTVQAGASTLTVSDVLVGDVWLCSGQSNMTYNLWGWTPGGHGHAAVAKANYPLIRFIDVPQVPASHPRDSFKGSWQVCTPKTIGWFSAVGYYFGRDLFRKLHVPIGLIESSWPGTPIQPWTPLSAVRDTPQLHNDYLWITSQEKQYEANKKAFIKAIAAWLPKARASLNAGRDIPNPPPEPWNFISSPGYTSLYNGMIHPLVPFAIRGNIWYQGESNVNDNLYYVRLKTLIKSWRKAWHEGNFPFYLVEIAPFDYGNPATGEPVVWNAQENVVRTVPNTGIAGTQDIGTIHDVHPFDKRDVGYRLSLWALAKTYGQKGFVYAGPMYKSMTVSDGKAVIHFQYASDGLVSRDGKPLTWFQIAGKNKKFVTAQAAIVGHTVVVQSPEVANPTVVRFAWNQIAVPNLMNKAGLPALPFDTDQVITAAKGN